MWPQSVQMYHIFYDQTDIYIHCSVEGKAHIRSEAPGQGSFLSSA